MPIPRPDLSGISNEVRNYIDYLETELARVKRVKPSTVTEETDETEQILLIEPDEPPTTTAIITATAGGVIKRTFRHLYSRQRRGGMGVFDLDTPENDPPVLLASVGETQTLLIFTDQGRAYRLPATTIPASPVRDRGSSIIGKLNLSPDERLTTILSEQAQGYVALASQRGFIRLLRHHVFGEYMKPGMSVFDTRVNGPLVSACWTPGDGDLFVATQKGKAIRFSEKLVSPNGTQGIRLEADDQCVAIAGVYQVSKVFMLGSDGKGTLRSMENFSPNKAPGSGGKAAMNVKSLTGAITVEDGDEIFIITRLSKIIRYSADQMPIKEGVVQGVVCIALRGDTPSAITNSR